MLSRDLWNRILKQLQLLSAISMPLGIMIELLEESHFFALSTLSAESNGGSEMISKPLESRDTVVFSDESQFAQFSDSG